MKARWLDRRIACPGPYLSLVTSQKEFDAALKHLGHPIGVPFIKTKRADATAHYLDNDKGELVVIVALGDVGTRSAIEIAGLLVHEAVHAWQQYCESIGETRPGDEQEAYGVQCIAQELMAEYARRIEANN